MMLPVSIVNLQDKSVLQLTVEYRRLAAGAPLPPDALAAIGFGPHAALPADPRCIRAPLEPLEGGGVVELWRGAGNTTLHADGAARYACNGDYAFGVVEIDERDHGDICSATAAAYDAVRRLQLQSDHPHILRMWNHLDAINRGNGDAERYKQFCIGRARSMQGWAESAFPAATAIGRPIRPAVEPALLQVFWMAGRRPGEMVENPRQVSAFRYPRQYGPISPSFSRAVLAHEAHLLMISGTASIVGHVSLHPGDLLAQCAETLTNLRSVLQRVQETGASLERDLGERSLLKVYLRIPQAAGEVAAFLRKSLGTAVPYLILQADICRRDLLVEMDCTHGGASAARPAANAVA